MQNTTLLKWCSLDSLPPSQITWRVPQNKCQASSNDTSNESRWPSYLETVNLLILWNVFVFLQSRSSDKRCQLRISKEFKRLPDCCGRLLKAQSHSQGCHQQIALTALLFWVVNGRPVSFLPWPRLFGGHFGERGRETNTRTPVKIDSPTLPPK